MAPLPVKRAQHGGTLISLPGGCSYGRGLWQDSILGLLSPVELTKVEDIVYEAGCVEILGRTYHYSFYHELTLKGGAKQIVSLKSSPAADYWMVDKGCVIAITTYIDSENPIIADLLSSIASTTLRS